MKKKTMLIIVAAVTAIVVIIAIVLAVNVMNKESVKPDDQLLSQSDNTITTEQFLKDLLINDLAITSKSEDFEVGTVVDRAYELGIINDSDMDQLNMPINRQAAARLAHYTVNIVLSETDEENTDAARVIDDLFSCRTCVEHITQVYVKGIMPTRENNMFCGGQELTKSEADEIIKRVYDVSLREPKSASMLLPEDSDTGEISPDEALDVMATNDKALLIDVRTLDEYNTGYILGSVCIPLNEIQDNLDGTDIPKDKDSVIIFYCQKGTRSAEARRILKEAGYTNVYNLGGIESWPYEVIGEISRPEQ